MRDDDVVTSVTFSNMAKFFWGNGASCLSGCILRRHGEVMSHFGLEMHFEYFCLPRKVEAPPNMHFLVQDRNYEHSVLMPSFGKW